MRIYRLARPDQTLASSQKSQWSSLFYLRAQAEVQLASFDMFAGKILGKTEGKLLALKLS